MNYNRTTISGNLNPATLFQALKTNSDFAQQVADETYRLFYNNGPLQSNGTIDNPKTLYDAQVANINIAIVGESARWGYDQASPSMTRDDDWIPVIIDLDNNYFPQRSTVVLAQLQAIFPMLAILPPSFNVNGVANRGGQVALNSLLTFSDTNSTTSGDAIYYTLDGSDPRTSATAVLYTGAIAINNTYTVKVRIKNGTTWSPIDSATYDVHTAAAPGNVTITELDYHPADATPAELAINPAWTDSDFEFIELTNVSAQTIDMVNAKFDLGVTFTFASTVLAPGQRVVVVSNPTAFRARYGSSTTIAGTYTGHLSNSSATVELKSATNAVIQNFTYSDSGDWPDRADGDGSSLEAVSVTGPFTAASNWRASYEYNGTPGTAGNPITDVVINEILPAPSTGGQQAIELYNTTSSSINIGGWYLSNARSNYYLFRIPTNTIIAANGYVVFTSADFNPTPSNPGPNDFSLDGTDGDNLLLVKATAGGALLAFADEQEFDTAAIGESFGRWPTGTGALYPMSSITLGAANSGPRIGPVTITELNYNPTAGTANLQFVELQNQTNAVVDISNWQFNNGITYTFPSGTLLQPFEAVTVVHFDPSTDATSLAAFRSTYGLTSANRLLGPFTDKLSKSGEKLELVRPDTPRVDNPSFTPLVMVDEVTYGIAAPWPVTAVGQPIVRQSNHIYATDPTNWKATAASVDQVSYGNAWFEGAAAYTYTSGAALDSLNLNNTAVVNLTAGSGSYLRTGTLSLQSGTKLNLNNGSLIIDSGSLSIVTGLVRSGFNITGTKWAGTGINSATAASGNLNLYAIGVLVNNNGSGVPIYTTGNLFAGQAPALNAVLAKYTYFGDANLNGRVDGTDYTLIDNGFGSHGTLTGWSNGDFNYDGVIDGSDYSLIDNAFNTQSATIAGVAATPAAEIFAPPATKAKLSKAQPFAANLPVAIDESFNASNTILTVADLLKSDSQSVFDWV